MKSLLRATTTIFIIFFLTFTINANAVTTSGKITNPETWSGEVVLTGDVTISGGGRLTINPGTVVKSEPDTDDQQGGVDENLIELIIEGGILGFSISKTIRTSDR